MNRAETLVAAELMLKFAKGDGPIKHRSKGWAVPPKWKLTNNPKWNWNTFEYAELEDGDLQKLKYTTR